MRSAQKLLIFIQKSIRFDEISGFKNYLRNFEPVELADDDWLSCPIPECWLPKIHGIKKEDKEK